MEDKIIVAIIINRLAPEKLVNSFSTATAVPVLASDIENNAMKDNPVIAVFIAPIKIKNSFFVISIKSVPTIAA